jgi:hypothetical protein
MAKTVGRKRDFVELARGVVEQAIGEQMDGGPLEIPVDLRNQNAVALGRLGGKKGGKARAAKLAPAQRKRIAKKAAQARWSGKSST